ncbi:MAG TPA: gluconate 2-dehydrogenase subunit 3 family protein [Candidatus Acidoferrales bacterium]|nr:gluconate 2-dehydrogenase subunit 3 family protein [Candidatus Acidoferrales bacterium]
MNSNQTHRLSRREAIQWALAASAAFALLDWRAFGAGAVPAKGYGLDPDLMESYNPGDLWPLTLTEAQRRTATALCDVIIPADGKSPAASELHVVDFIDEWISAPYGAQQQQRETVVNGLIWLESESHRRFQKSFDQLSEAEQHAICDDICFAPKAAPELKTAATFFSVFRDLTTGGFYTTPAGWRDIGYVGNVALAHFDGPPPEVLKYVGLM